MSREQFDVKTVSSDSHGSDSDESVYKEFVSRCAKNKITSTTKSPRSSPTLALKGEAEPVVNTPAIVTTPPLSTPSPQISVAAGNKYIFFNLSVSRLVQRNKPKI